MNYTEPTELNGSGNITKIKLSELEKTASQNGIAVLLLDAENLQLNSDTERFLTPACTYPIQIKIAFANWCSMGKLDIDLHRRGYDLIHVPVGKDNADGKMIAFGSSIHERYSNAKEVLVCSSDKVMTNLCNQLQQHGLTVYQVSKKGEDIIVLNSYTGEIVTEIANFVTKIPAIAQFIQQIKELIKAEQQRINNCWVKLDIISQNYQHKYKLTIAQVSTKHFSSKKNKDIFIDYPADFVIHQIHQSSPVYITLFEINLNKDELISNPIKSSLLPIITNNIDLENVLKNIVYELTKNSPGSYISISILGSEFKQKYNKPITEQIKNLQLSGNFIKFLQSCTSLKLKQTPKGWEIAVK